MNGKVKTCKTCGKTFHGAYCKNRSCPKNKAARLRNAKNARLRYGGGKMHFDVLSHPTEGTPIAISGQGTSNQLAVNISALPENCRRIETIEQANVCDELFLALCDADTDALMAMRDEQDYSRAGW